MSMKNLVLGAAIGYPFEKVQNFIISLKETEFDGDVGLIITHDQVDLAAQLRSLGVRLFYFEGAPFYRVKPNQSRFIKKFEILQEERDTYSRVFMSDVRDVIFQKNPFEHESDKALSVVLEEAPMTIGNCRFNSKWIKRLFGRKTLKEIGDNSISCCGTVLGTVDGMNHYLQKMLKIGEAGNARAMRIMGIDQGIHNFMLYTGILDDFEILENRVLVNTMGHVDQGQFSQNADGLVENREGSISPVVHQYDRFPELEAALNEKFQNLYERKYR